MRKIFNLSSLLLLCMAFMLPALTSCNDDNDDFDTQQYKGGVNLNVWGPRPVARGGELRFLGSGMDQITSITIPGSASDVTDIRVISSEEIRITVPQDAEPGLVVLHHAGGDIKSITELTFLEPISLDEMTPSPVKPGTTLTLKGDYLNLIHEVILAEEVAIPEEDFITHTRKEISFVVPAEAQTGQIILSDGEEPIPNWIYSEEELQVVLPSVAATLDLTGAKPGETVKIKVTDIDLVTKVEMPNGDEVEYTVTEDELSFTLPENVSDGTVCMIPASGVKVAIATIGVAVPGEVEAVPATDIWSGDVIKIKGVNIELVTEITFPGVEAPAKITAQSATEISVIVPEGTQSGNAVLKTASGAAVEVAVSTLKPQVLSFEPAEVPAAASFTIKGKNLNLIKKFTFAGGAVEETTPSSSTEFTMIAPATAETGEITLTMINDEEVKTPVLTILTPECTYITVQPEGDLTANDLFVATLGNPDKLEKVTVNGTEVQFIINNGNLYITLPSSCGAGTVVTLISSNGEISYTYDVIPATHQERVVFTGPRDLGSWAGEGDGGAFRIYKDAFEGVPAGAKLIFHIAPYAYTQIQVNDANWGEMDMLKPDQSATTAEFELTAEILNRILTTNDGWSETAMVIQGEGTVVSKVTVEWEIPTETVAFEGEYELAWGPHLYLEKELFAGIKPGAVLRAYFKENKSGYQLQLNHDNWDGFYTMAEWSEPKNMLEHTLTADEVNGILNPKDGIYGMILQGDGNILVKFTWENQ